MLRYDVVPPEVGRIHFTPLAEKALRTRPQDCTSLGYWATAQLLEDMESPLDVSEAMRTLIQEVPEGDVVNQDEFGYFNPRDCLTLGLNRAIMDTVEVGMTR